MLSRVAESIYWLNRYIERAENYSRFIDVNYGIAMELEDNDQAQWGPLIQATGDQENFEKNYDSLNADNVMEFMTFSRENPNSILSCVAMARENARRIRENISLEMWESINRFFLRLKDFPDRSAVDDARLQEFYGDIRRECVQFYGFQEATISHDEVWNFGLLGRLLERADKTTRILDIKYFMLLPAGEPVGGALDHLQWVSLLKSASALEMYSRRYQNVAPREIAEFLVIDKLFPRSINFAIHYVNSTLRKISGTAAEYYSNDAEKLAGRHASDLNFTNIDEIFATGMHEFLDDQQSRLNAIGDAVARRYFNL